MLVDLIHGSLPWFGQQPREKIALLKEHLNDSEYMHVSSHKYFVYNYLFFSVARLHSDQFWIISAL